MQRARKTDLRKIRPLRKSADFQAAAKSGRKWVSKSLILQIRPNEMNIIRVGYVVSKRVDQSAVKRNRIKRRLRAAVADVMPFGAAGGFDYVLIGRVETATRDYADLCQDLRWCLQKLGCLP
ncbi:MAG: ribonuclease P protein component [Alphaproteobacteria bacterium]|nr:ribonuclease P protein component [Alphaproteobacteria bacterium]